MVGIAVGLVVLAGLLVWRASTPELTVFGDPARNPDEVLAAVQDRFDVVVDVSGASVTENADCLFGLGNSPQGPQVVCGPVLLGTSAIDEPWLVGQVSWSPDGTGFFEDFIASGFDQASLVGAFEVDRLPPYEPGDLPRPTGGVRTQDGALVRPGDVQLALDEAEAQLGVAVAAEPTTTSEDTGCWLGSIVARDDGLTVPDGYVWCGPVLTLDADPAGVWVRAGVTVPEEAGDVPGTVGLTLTGGLTGWFGGLSPAPLEPAIELWRPDGTPAPDATGLTLPDPDPVAETFIGWVEDDERLDNVEWATPEDPLFAIPDLAWTLDGVARVDRVGAGRGALVAPPGHDLVAAVGQFERLDSDLWWREASIDAAVVVVDGVRRPVEDYGFREGRTSLVVSVPESASSVDLELLVAQRSQTLSLLTGRRGPATPTGLYADIVGPKEVNDHVLAALELSDGQRIASTVTINRVDVTPYFDGAWAPDGQTFVVLDYDREVDYDSFFCSCTQELMVGPVGGESAGPTEETDGEAWLLPGDVEAITIRERLALDPDEAEDGLTATVVDDEAALEVALK